MQDLRQILSGRSIQNLIWWADSLDPNHSWDELVESDPSITALDLVEFFIAAYDSADTVEWANSRA